MSSSSTKEHQNNQQEMMAKAQIILEFTLENLQLSQQDPHESISPNLFQDNIISLSEDLKYMRYFIKRLQETPPHNKLTVSVSYLVSDIVQQISEILVSTDYHVHEYIVKPLMNFSQAEATSSSSSSSPDAPYRLNVKLICRKLIREIKSILILMMWSNSEEIDEFLPDFESKLQICWLLKLNLGYIGLIRVKEEIPSIHEDLEFISSFVKRMQDNPNCLHASPDHISRLMAKVGHFLNMLKIYLGSTTVEMYRNLMIRVLSWSPKIQALVKYIKAAEQDVLVDGGSNEVEFISSTDNLFTQNVNSGAEEKVVVIGMEDETQKLLNRLIGGWKQLKVIQVIGMPGIGKTTLACKLYNDPSTACYFHVRAWACVSQSYGSRELLCDILRCIVGDNDPALSLSEEDIGHRLYKCLKGYRYLIVLDDVWDVQVWNGLQIYLPNDGNSSRVIVTCRNKDVVPEELLSENPPHFLRLLREDESWDLFRCKVLDSSSFSDSEELIQVGKEIVATCKGLPIAIVLVGGLLAKEEKTTENWKQLAKTIRRSSADSNSRAEYLMDILDLSYKHLPSQLKSCFLYLGSFPEDYEFSVKSLIRSWIAQGFIECTAEKELEDVAEGYIMNLINRSLLLVAKRRSDGGIKSFQIHDLLRDLCIKKSVEKNFLQPICRCGSNAKPFLFRHPRFSDCHYFHSYGSHFVSDSVFIGEDFQTLVQYLRVLDLRGVIFYKYPERVCELFHLKYLALQVDHIENIPHFIFELCFLETFILEGEKGGRVELVPSIVEMKWLRHFHVSQELFCAPMSWLNLDPRSTIYSLQTISNVSASDSSLHALLSRTPNLRKLGLHGTLSMTDENLAFPTLSNLKVLETLKFEYQTLGMKPFTIRSLLDFPQSLKKLTLIGSCVDWSGISIISRLPNLEVLKLKDNFFHGPRWETSDDDNFQSLKLLKLSHMDLKQWICSSASDHFPKLEQLVINGCLDLEEIPADMGEIPTLHTINVYRSSESVVESAREIQETQISYGNSDFKVFIFLHFQEH